MTCEKKSTKKSPAYGRGFKPNFSVRKRKYSSNQLLGQTRELVYKN